MKKGITILITIAMVIISIGTFISVSFAQGDQLVIDNRNKYVGMNNSYSEGYKPTIKDGKATIILPLVHEGKSKILGNKIRVTPDLGAPTDSPFSFSNYEMSVSLADNPVNDGKSKVSGYLIRLEVPLSKDRINGTYPIIINTKFSIETSGRVGSEEQGEPINGVEIVEQAFTVYLTINDGKDPNAVEPEPVPEPEPEPEPRPQPKIVIDEYGINPEVVMAGKTFDVEMVLKNTEKTWGAHNIKLTYKGETDDILPEGKTNTLFIDEIPKGKTYELTLHMKTRLDAEPKPQKILLIIEYEDSARTAYTVNEEILIEVRQPLRLEVDEINIPGTVNAGESLPISTDVFNMGKSTLYNVRCTLEMPGVIPDGSAFLGNMEPGESGSVEIYAFFGTLDMGGSDKSEDDDSHNHKAEDKEDKEDTSRDDGVGKYGRSQGIMTITYEDEYGEEHKKIIQLSTNIERPVFDDPNKKEEEPEEKPERASQWWISVSLAAGVAMILYGAISYNRKVNKLRREYGNEDI